MMLADKLLQHLHAGKMDAAGDFAAQMERAARFAFDAPTSTLAANAVMRPADVAKAIPLPAPEAWIELELPELAIGLLVKTEGSDLRTGRALLARLPKGASVLTLGTALVDMDEGGIIGIDAASSLALMGAVALLATPSLCRKRDVDMSRLNKSRARSGKPPLFSHKAITIDLGKPDARTPFKAGDGHSRRHHFVRAFLRFRKSQMELVRPHWRGDATRGVALPHFRVTA